MIGLGIQCNKWSYFNGYQMPHIQVNNLIKIYWLKEKNVFVKGKPREKRKLGFQENALKMKSRNYFFF